MRLTSFWTGAAVGIARRFSTRPAGGGMEAAWRRLPGLAPALLLALCATASAGNYFQGVSPSNSWWPGGQVPYLFDPAYPVTPAESGAILAGLREWELAAGVSFVPYTNQNHYALLEFTNDGSGTGYCLHYGSGAGTFAVMMLHGLSRGLVCHETGHLLGLQHEHQRDDRDNYITVNYANVAGGTNGEGLSAFVIDTNSTAFGAYDLVSVMHYGPDSFTNGGGDALDPLPPYEKFLHKIGNPALSAGDRAAAANLYGPPATPLTNIVTTTADGGSGSLRAALYYANDHPGTTIQFNVPANDPGYRDGVIFIQPLGESPPVTGAGTIVDGATQPGYRGAPVVVMDGSRVPPEAGAVSGLSFYGANGRARSLAFGNFPYAGLRFYCSDAVGNGVESCYIGLLPDGATAAPNGAAGVVFQFGAAGNSIGGSNAARRNIISGNAYYGVQINDTNSDGNIILGNYIGLDPTGRFAVPNQYSGVGIWGGPRDNIIGGAVPGAGNVISGNGQYGVWISDPGVSGMVVQGNYIGTDAAGENVVSNGFGGAIVINGAGGVIIGGTNAAARNVISGNGAAGVYLAGPGGGNNVVQGNYLGVNAAGAGALGNSAAGVYLVAGAGGNLIGGPAPGAGNLISGNGGYGLFISDPGTSNNVIEGNLIGTDAAGRTALGNGAGGIGLGLWGGASGNVVGGPAPGAGNIISGNGGYGAAVGGANANVFQGNFIGTDLAGGAALPNGFAGLALWGGSSGNVIGGAAAGEGNLLSGNATYGLFVGDTNTSGNVVEGNAIGADVTGTNALGNGFAGIVLQNGADGNFIGGPGPGAGNVIAFAAGPGVVLYDAGTTNNAIRGNSIFGNGAPGIDFNNDGAATNQAGFPAGPNDLQSSPLITKAAGRAGATVVAGTLRSAANELYAVDLYRSPAAGPGGNGQGKFYLGSVHLTTDSSGSGGFAFTNGSWDAAAPFISATATSAGGDTSEFSAAVAAVFETVPSAQFSGPLTWGTGGFAFTLSLQTNFSYRVQFTTNLAANPVAWVDAAGFIATNVSQTFTNAPTTNTSARFYRVISP